VRAGQACTSGTSDASASKTRVVGAVQVAVMVLSSVVGRTITSVAKTTNSASTNVLGHTLELVVALLAAAEDTALGLELIHSHHWQSSGVMVSGLVVVNLVDRDSGVDNVGLDDLAVDDGLDGLVNVLQWS
jgi:hypothetical protein